MEKLLASVTMIALFLACNILRIDKLGVANLELAG